MSAKHMSSQVNAEYSLCGEAFDGETGAAYDDDDFFAQAGEIVTCERCCATIAACRSLLSVPGTYKYRVRKEN